MPDIQANWLASFRQRIMYSRIRWLLLVLVIPEQGPALAFVEAGDPGVLVGESPGLEKFAARLLHAQGGDFTVEFGLGGERGRARVIEADIEFGDVQFEAEVSEPLQISGIRREFGGILRLYGVMCLEADSVGRAAPR